MGGVNSNNINIYNPPKDYKGELNLSVKLTPEQVRKHKEDNAQEDNNNCTILNEIPSSVLECVWLYEKLDASFNRLKLIPQTLPLCLPHLTYLNLSYNHLESLPGTINLFIHLRTLLVPHNRISEIPESLGWLEKLKVLDVSNNRLKQFPETFKNLERVLKKLNVRNNRLTLIPKYLSRFQHLEVILAEGNESLDPPQSICDGGSDAVIKYLRLYCAQDADQTTASSNIFPRFYGIPLQVKNCRAAVQNYFQVQGQTISTSNKICLPLLPPEGATVFHPEELRNKILGLIYGAVIGDALGKFTDSMSPDQCRFHYDRPTSFVQYENQVRDQHRLQWELNAWTGNVDQIVIILESIIRWGGVVDELDFAERLLSWSQRGLMDDGPPVIASPVLSKVLDSKNFLSNPNCVSRTVYEGSNESNSAALSRAIPLGIPHFYNEKEVACNSFRICCSTNAHPHSLLSSVTVSLIISKLLQGKTNLSSSSELELLLSLSAAAAIVCVTEASESEIAEFEEAFNKSSQHSLSRQNSSLWSLRVLIEAIRLFDGDFEKGLLTVLMQGGSSTVNGCVVGAVLGCVTGYSDLPEHWIRGLSSRHKDLLDNKLNSLLDLMGLP